MTIPKDLRTDEGALSLGSGTEARSAVVPDPREAANSAAPDAEVVAKPRRRRFSAAYRLRILEEADRCTGPGEIGQLLRREGLYSSHLTHWRKARHQSALADLSSKKRGPKPKEKNPLEPRVRELEGEVKRLQTELKKAHTILEVQEKVAGLLGLNPAREKNS